MGSRTLQEERNDWEPREHTTLVTHFEVQNRNAYISILVEVGLDDNKQGPVMYYDMIRYFQIRNEWFASYDIKSGSAEDVFRKIGEVI